MMIRLRPEFADICERLRDGFRLARRLIFRWLTVSTATTRADDQDSGKEASCLHHTLPEK